MCIGGGGLFALKNEDERKNEAAAVFAKWLTEKDNNLAFVTEAGYLPITDDAFATLFDNTEAVENEKYRMLYNAVRDMTDRYVYCDIPVYEGASEMQASFEKNVQSVLSTAHEQYWSRIAEGEDANAVMNELTEATLTKLRDLYK